MEKSESIKNLAAALITFHVKVENVKKDSTNPFFKSKYASLSNILDVIHDPLQESDLAFCQFPSGEHGLTTILMHKTGEFISESYTMRPTKDDPQGTGSAITYQRRYALASVLGLNIEDDDDGNAASKPIAKYESNGKETGITKEHGEEKPWLNFGLQYNAVVKRLKEGTTNLKTVQQHYKLNKEVRAKLEEIINEEAPF